MGLSGQAPDAWFAALWRAPYLYEPLGQVAFGVMPVIASRLRERAWGRAWFTFPELPEPFQMTARLADYMEAEGGARGYWTGRRGGRCSELYFGASLYAVDFKTAALWTGDRTSPLVLTAKLLPLCGG